MKRNKKRGAILITTVVLATGIALAIGTFVALALHTAKMSNNAFHFNSSLNLAEAGLERAMIAINTDDLSGWSSRTLGGATARTQSFGPYDLGETKGFVDVAIFDYGSRTPRVVAQGRTTGGIGSSVRKQIEIYLSQRSDFENGLVAKNKITLVGNNVTVDSYDSEDTAKFPGGQFVEGGPRNDNGSVASAIVEESATGADLGNADIWGMVATSGSQVVYKPNGTVLGEDSPSGVKVDPERVTHDFVGEFSIQDPDTAVTYTHYESEEKLPTETIDGVVCWVIDGATTPNVRIDQIALSGSERLVFKGEVTLWVPTYSASADSISVTGNASIVLKSSGTIPPQVTVFVEGNVKIAGNGIANPGLPKDFIVHGTNDTVHQSIHIAGNGQMKVAVNAPNAEVKLGGGGVSGSVCGAIVGYNITLNGGYPFHYDEALKRLGGDNPMRLGLWRELIKASEQLAF